MEGILAAVTQAKEFFIRKFLIYSDSQIYLDNLNVLYAAQLTGVKVDKLFSMGHSKTGLANKDLFEKILLNLKNAQVSFQFIPGELNFSADALSRLYWSSQNNDVLFGAKGKLKVQKSLPLIWSIHQNPKLNIHHLKKKPVD